MSKFFLAILVGVLFLSANARVSMASDPTGWNFVTEQDVGAALCHIKVIVRSGSLSDPVNRPGLTHFTARAMMRGTETRPYQELNSSIEALGGSISVGVDQTQTVFDAQVLTANLDAFLDLLRDVLTNPAFAVTDMNLLQKILFGELASELEDPSTLASRALMQASYAGLPLQNPVNGTLTSVSQITPQDVLAFFQIHYVRENILIGVTSPLAPADMVSKVELALDSIPHGKLDMPKLSSSNMKGLQAVIVDRKGMASVPIYIATAGTSDVDPNRMALDIGNFVFGGDFTSRLMQVLRAQNGWTYGASSGYAQTMVAKAQPGLFSIYAFPSAEFFDVTVAKALSMFQAYVSSGITAAELAFAQSALSNSYAFEQDTAEKRLAQDLRTVLTGRVFPTAAQYSTQVAQQTLVGVNAAIAKTDDKNLMVAVVGDATVLQPILAALPGMKSVTVVQINP